MIGWFTKILDQGVLLIRELREALGRMIFVYGALQWDRPFLGPLFGLLSHHQPGECIQIPLFVRTIFDWLRSRLRQRRSYPCHLKRSRLGALMRVDARADIAVAVGGWRPTRDENGHIDRSRSPWFAVELNRSNAPWAFHKGEPYKAISALELFATLLGTIAFAPAGGDGEVECAAVVTSHTDSQVAAYALTRLMSSSFPLCCVLMELAARLEESRTILELNWIPREENQEADDLSNLKI